MTNPIADYLFLAAMFVPTAAILAGVIFLLLPQRASSAGRTQAVEAKAH